MRKHRIILIFICMFCIASLFSNFVEAAEVNIGKYIVYTKSIKVNNGIYEVSIRYSSGGTPMFIEFSKINGVWKHRDAVGGYDWKNVSDSKDMNDVLYVVLHSYEYE